VFDPTLRVALSLFSPAGKRSRLSVVVFHRVLPVSDPLFPDAVDAARFDAICGWLADWFHVLPLDLAVQRLKRGTLPARALSITFDDGYADNEEIAAPILRRHGLCATFFVASGHLDGGRMWNDSVVESLRRCSCVSLDLSALGVSGLGRIELRSLVERRRSIMQVLAATKYLPPADRKAAVDTLTELAAVRLPDDLMMSSRQVRCLADAGMQIGAHTVSHPILASLDDDAARHEIAQSKLHLECLVGRGAVTLFAYPNGRPGSDFLPRDAELVRCAGFSAAFTTAAGAATVANDEFQLPRFTPWDRSRQRFGARMLRNLFA
jgi:peptidoglycan/xylan/chitin deacetylase (PgdA/CDA1 family)